MQYVFSSSYAASLPLRRFGLESYQFKTINFISFSSFQCDTFVWTDKQI